MAYQSQTASQTNGNIKETATYGVDTSGFGYSIITDDIKQDFNFLIQDLPNKLDEVQRIITQATDNQDAFFATSGGTTITDLSRAGEELKQDIQKLKTNLFDLYNAFMTDIDNVNAELEYNFGWIVVGEVKGSTKSETIETETTTPTN